MSKIILVLNILPILGLTCVGSNWIYKNKMFSELNILQCIQNDVVINFNDVIRIVHCAPNIESAQSVSILTFERISKATQNIITMQFYFVVIIMHGMKDSESKTIITL